MLAGTDHFGKHSASLQLASVPTSLWLVEVRAVRLKGSATQRVAWTVASRRLVLLPQRGFLLALPYRDGALVARLARKILGPFRAGGGETRLELVTLELIDAKLFFAFGEALEH